MSFSQQAARRVTSPSLLQRLRRGIASSLALSQRFMSSAAQPSPESKHEPSASSTKPSEQPPSRKKTQAELDKELELKMQGLSGDGGESGIEYEDGQPVSMKRSVKNNMFRYI